MNRMNGNIRGIYINRLGNRYILPSIRSYWLKQYIDSIRREMIYPDTRRCAVKISNDMNPYVKVIYLNALYKKADKAIRYTWIRENAQAFNRVLAEESRVIVNG